MHQAALPVTLISLAAALCGVNLPPLAWVGVLLFIFLCEICAQDKISVAPARGPHA